MPYVITRRSAICVLAASAGLALRGGRARAEEPVKAAYPVAVPGYQVMYVAAAKGFLKEEGLDIKLVQAGSGTKTREIFASGQADFAMADILHCLQLNNRGRPSWALAAADTRSPSARWTIRRDLHQQGIDTIQKLVAWKRPDGKRPIFGVSSLGGTAHLWAHFYMEKFGLADQVTWVGVGNVDTMLGSLKTKQIDILATTVSLVADADKNGWGTEIFNGSDPKNWNSILGGPIPVNVNMCLKSVAEKDPAKVQAYTNAIWRAVQWIKASSPETIYGAIEPYVGSTSREANLLEIESVKDVTDYDGTIREDAFARGAKAWFTELTGIKPLTLADAFDPKFLRAAQAKHPA